MLYFDLDGVLVDSRPGIEHCVNAALVAAGFESVSGPELDSVIGPPLYEGFARLLRLQHGDPGRASELVLDYRERYLEACVAGTVLQPGVATAISALAIHTPLAVATSKPLRFATPILDALGLLRFFATVVGPTPEFDRETKTQTLGRAVDEMRALRGDAVARDSAAMVGDREHDMFAARAHGFRAVGALWGYGSAVELSAAGADVLLAAPAELFALDSRSV